MWLNCFLISVFDGHDDGECGDEDHPRVWYSSDYSKWTTFGATGWEMRMNQNVFLKGTSFSAALQKLRMLNLQSGMDISSVPFELLFVTDSIKG